MHKILTADEFNKIKSDIADLKEQNETLKKDLESINEMLNSVPSLKMPEPVVWNRATKKVVTWDSKTQKPKETK